MSSPELFLLPDDLIRCIMRRCTARALVCLASTCRRARELADQVPLPPVTLTCQQTPSVMRWLWSPGIADRVSVLVARRCLYGQCQWTERLTELRSLTFAFCRVRSCALKHLPTSLRRLDMHQVLPPPGVTHSRMCFRRLRRLRSLDMVFNAPSWDAAFVAGLPRGLRELRMRGCRALVVESFVPRGLRIARLHASNLLLLSNRLPNGVRAASLECDRGSVWLRDTLPLRPSKLRDLTVRCPMLSSLPDLDTFACLRTLRLEVRSLVVSAAQLGALRHLRHLELRASNWLGFSDLDWPRHKPPPETLVATVDHVAVRRLPFLTATSDVPAPTTSDTAQAP